MPFEADSEAACCRVGRNHEPGGVGLAKAQVLAGAKACAEAEVLQGALASWAAAPARGKPRSLATPTTRGGSAHECVCDRETSVSEIGCGAMTTTSIISHDDDKYHLSS